MKVLLSSHGAGLYGAERMILALAEGLGGRGHEVVLEFPHPGPAVDAARAIPDVEVVMSHRARLPRNLLEGARFLLGIPGAVMALRKIVGAVKPEVTWVNSLFNPWALLGARSSGCPVVWHLHERNPGLPLGILVPALAGVAGVRIAVISTYVAESLAPYPWLGEMMARLDNPLLKEIAPVPREPRGPFTVGYVGQLEPRKRAPDLARALRRLPGVRAAFVGDGKARGELEKAIRESGVEERVEILGFRENAPEEFGRFHCVAIPSIREPFGLVALEAMASGIPVVAARSGALPEVLGDAALFHVPRDPEDLGEKIRRLEASPRLRDELRSRGLARVVAFHREGWLDKVERILGDAAGRAEGR